MLFKRAYLVDKKSYKYHTQKIFCSKHITNSKVNKILTNNSLTNPKTRAKIRYLQNHLELWVQISLKYSLGEGLYFGRYGTGLSKSLKYVRENLF